MADTALARRVSKLESKILQWLTRTPASAERLTLVAVGMPDSVLMDIPAEDAAKLQPSELAAQLHSQAEEWADGCDRECRFIAQWWRAESPVLTLQFRTGQSYNGAGPGQAYDGTASDIIGQLQRHVEAQQRTMVGAIKTVLDAQNYVIERQRMELQDMRADMARVREREEEIRQDELASIVEETEQDDQKLFRLVGLVTEAVKQLQDAGVMPPQGERH